MKTQRTIGFLAIASVAVASFIGLFVVPADEYQGEIQRLLYIDVPTAWLAMLSFLVVFLMSLLYLVQRKLKWDVLAVSAVEIGVLSTALTLIVG